MKITMTKTGRFSTVRGKEAQYQCGVQGMTVFDYEVAVTCSHKALNKETGFIVDNAIVANYFDNYHDYETQTGSCELIATNAVAFFRSVLDDQGIAVKKLRVRIQGSLTAYFVASWRGKKTPKFVKGAARRTEVKTEGELVSL